MLDGVNMAMVSQLYQEKTNTNETKGNWLQVLEKLKKTKSHMKAYARKQVTLNIRNDRQNCVQIADAINIRNKK